MAENLAKSARKASNILKTLSNDKRTSALKVIHDSLRDSKDEIIEANKLDLKLAEEADLPDSLIRRLDLAKGDKYDSMLQGILDVAALEDPVGRISLSRHLDDGLDLYRVSCPVGVLLVIFEARPEVIANITALAIKSGNAAILKGGKESLHTFSAMATAVKKALAKTSIPPDAIHLVSTREQVGELLHQDKYIDLVIPRGSNELVRQIKASTRIAVLGHADGICSIYVHDDADGEMAGKIIVDSKVNYPAGCNAVETVLINKNLLSTSNPAGQAKVTSIIEQLVDAKVKVKIAPEIEAFLTSGDNSSPSTIAIPCPQIEPATEADFDREFLSLTIAIKSITDIDEAIAHINEHGSHHTDAIITASKDKAEKFLKGVDSAGVFWNASTRFADGFRFGFGTEVGVSTNKLHARGPVGLEGLMSYQYQIKGSGQIVGDYAGSGGSKRYLHQDFTVDNN
ncbi:glutamate-5-semialdehyde dehydrogenase [Sugiyamaella lignohabitans]|uniref:glutamate-5-semialdehyde dehydrogenase n=1 Tax=Sugiyamaella lignohabitans TaxID=796027 RepID=A0A167E692_9ASCO|nr:glutamate-5-semialdehyde dehydrogenase [Sugiyamaella lignohabitans]ANB13694.1 glutamate-5-semialdehyde dehydrogenase [Sugiyamaella lignohabitans]